MNKKIIKYLIWIIIITAMLILMPGKEAKAEEAKEAKEVKLSEFSKSKNLFCLNKGWYFGASETFSVENIKNYINDDNKFSLDKNETNTIDVNILDFIISESGSSAEYEKRETVSSYIPQIAIWKLRGNNINNPEADKLIANAVAYKEFIKYERKPYITKDGNKVTINYYKAIGNYNGTTGEYTNLLKNTITINKTANNTEDSGLSANSGGWYNITYTFDSPTEINIKFKYEIKRDSNLAVYSPQNKETISYTKIGDNEGSLYYLLYGKSDYRCLDCDENGFYGMDKITSDEMGKIFKYKTGVDDGETAEEYLNDEAKDIYNHIDDFAFYKCNNNSTHYLVIRKQVNMDKAEYSVLSFVTSGLTKRRGSAEKLEYSKSINAELSVQNLLYGSGSVSTSPVDETLTFGLDLTINKVDALNTNSKLSNAHFKIELTNVASIDKYQIAEVKDGETQNYPKQVYVTTDGNGQINLTGIIPTNYAEPITVTITETAVPPVTSGEYYYKVNSTPVNLTFTYNSSTGKWEEKGISDNTASVTIKNQPYIKLSGNVWEDGQIGEKGNVSGTNGVKGTDEKNLQGVIVELLDSDGKIVELLDSKGNKLNPTKTDANGNYSFTDIPKTNKGYKIRFKYNGITYKETPIGEVSIPTEDNRTEFNNKFKTISQGQSNNGTSLGYTYSNGTSTLNSRIDGYNPSSGNYDFQISATTGTYTETTETISCGLVKKNFDLAIGTDVKEAKLTINDKTTTYDYAQIMNGELNADFQNSSTSTNNVIYNLYLYQSDYNYRISDYKTDTTGGNIANTVNPSDNTVNNYENLKELEAYVTYSVILKSQTTNSVTETSTVEEFVYYYDSAFEPDIKSTNEYNVSIDTNARKITFTSKNGGFNLTSSNNYRATVDLTFKIKKDSNGNITTKTATNVAEITKYSTSEGGLIDKDSAPANGITNGQITKYEDDTDEAKGLNIVLKTEEARTITGTVFEDKDKNGNNNDNTPVSGVIVQLIEIKKIGGQYYEYIWQETVSGKNVVKTTERNGYEISYYKNNVEEEGKYEFKDFIPGNYIIRYIYGDYGKETRYTNWDPTFESTRKDSLLLANSMAHYNGQDYKSTKDLNYKSAWYNTAEYAVGDSIARDDEARRLEVMAFSTTIAQSVGQNLSKHKDSSNEHSDSWMCAETSKINVPVDADNKKTDSNQTNASYNYSKTNSKVLFGDMNFGLTLRPQTNLTLEKHITALKITPSGTGVQSIVDAKVEGIDKIVNGTEVEVKGVTSGLSTIKSTIANRGFWQVATDVEELMQGAELEVEYTYVIRNDSEEDYLTSYLIGEYEKGINDGSYNTLLNNKSIEVKNATKGQTQKYGNYLGEFYYTGSKGTNDALVTTRLEKFEETLNNDLVFDETTSTAFKTTEQSVKKQVYGVNQADGAKEEEINTVVQNKTTSKFLEPKTTETHTENSADWTKTIKLRTTLSTVSGGELGANLPSYIAQIVQYSNAAGRKDMEAIPGNLSYVHSDDSEMTMENSNERDEFWAESIIITKPTGEDKLTPLQIVIITISSLAVIGVGTILIKKFVLKK